MELTMRSRASRKDPLPPLPAASRLESEGVISSIPAIPHIVRRSLFASYFNAGRRICRQFFPVQEAVQITGQSLFETGEAEAVDHLLTQNFRLIQESMGIDAPQDSDQRRGDGFNLIRVDENSQFAAAQSINCAILIAGKRRLAAGERLKIDNAKPFSFARHGENVAKIIMIAQLFIRDVTG